MSYRLSAGSFRNRQSWRRWTLGEFCGFQDLESPPAKPGSSDKEPRQIRKPREQASRFSHGNQERAFNRADEDNRGNRIRPPGGYGGNFRPHYGQSGQRPSRPYQKAGPRRNGTVKFFKVENGFGFIIPDDGGNDIFVHISAVERSGLTTLHSEMRVSFEESPDVGGKGPTAVNLQVLENEWMNAGSATHHDGPGY